MPKDRYARNYDRPLLIFAVLLAIIAFIAVLVLLYRPHTALP